MSDASERPRKKKVLSPAAAERRRIKSRERMRRLRIERKKAGIPMYSEEQRLKRLAAYRKKYRENSEFRERVKKLSSMSSKRRYAKDKTPWIISQKKRQQRIAEDPVYRQEMREKAARRAAKRYAERQDVRERHSITFKKWKEKNPDYMRNYMRKYKARRLKEDVLFAIQHAIRTRLNVALRQQNASGSAVEELGCSIQEFKLHIESMFQPGMHWGNRGIGGWHLDHIIPLSFFDLSDPGQRKRACHFTNMQPLWQAENLKKKDRLPDGTSASVARKLARSDKRGAKCKTTVQRRKR
jgi:hypothetical protein